MDECEHGGVYVLDFANQPTRLSSCPFCRIDSITSKLGEAAKVAEQNETVINTCNREISRLKTELAVLREDFRAVVQQRDMSAGRLSTALNLLERVKKDLLDRGSMDTGDHVVVVNLSSTLWNSLCDFLVERDATAEYFRTAAAAMENNAPADGLPITARVVERGSIK